MSFSKVYSAQTLFLKAHTVAIEVDISNGLHAFSIVGLGDKSIEEARDRISAAIKNSGFVSPKSRNQKVVISLAPADVRKEGTGFDVGMAIGYLLSSEAIDFDPVGKLFLGELSLDGELRKIRGVLPIITHAKEQGYKEIYLPLQNVEEAALISGVHIFGAKTLTEIIEHLQMTGKITPATEAKIVHKLDEYSIDFRDIKGQESAKRGLEIAAAGGHNIALYGPPGTGKTMLAKAFSGILPPLSFEEMLEITSIHSVAGILKEHVVTNPPFRSPHHTSSYTSITGGGAYPKPGEVTLAHRGVLFLDELPEFDRRVIDSLREPLEERVISIARSKGSVQFPAQFILVSAMNPCPCGNFGVDEKECICPPVIIQRYQNKISGPVADRIDMWIEVSKVNYEKLSDHFEFTESTATIRKRVERARNIQYERYRNINIKINSELSAQNMTEYLRPSKDVRQILNKAATELKLSARSYHRVLKLSRTIADLASCVEIETSHVLEALQYRKQSKN